MTLTKRTTWIDPYAQAKLQQMHHLRRNMRREKNGLKTQEYVKLDVQRLKGRTKIIFSYDSAVHQAMHPSKGNKLITWIKAEIPVDLDSGNVLFDEASFSSFGEAFGPTSEGSVRKVMRILSRIFNIVLRPNPEYNKYIFMQEARVKDRRLHMNNSDLFLDILGEVSPSDVYNALMAMRRIVVN